MFWKFLGKALSGTAGVPSSKRFYCLLFCMLFTVLFISNLFFNKKVDSNILEFTTGLIAYFFTGIAAEKVLQKKQNAG